MGKSKKNSAPIVLGECVWILRGLGNSLTYAADGLKFVCLSGVTQSLLAGKAAPLAPGRFDHSAAMALDAYAKVLVCAVMEEWDRRFKTLADTDPAVRRTVDVAAPLVAEVERWPDLRTLRNQVLAHPSRNWEGSLVDPVALSASINAPTNFAATMLLALAAIGVCEVAARHHPGPLEAAVAEVHARFPRTPPPDGKSLIPERGARTFEDVAVEITRAWAGVLALDPSLDDLAARHRAWPTAPAF
jgi:hypothetical protein